MACGILLRRKCAETGPVDVSILLGEEGGRVRRVEVLEGGNEVHARLGILFCYDFEPMIGLTHEFLFPLFRGCSCGGGTEVGTGPWGGVVDG